MTTADSFVSDDVKTTKWGPLMGMFRKLNTARRLMRTAERMDRNSKKGGARGYQKQERGPEIKSETSGWAGKPVSAPTEDYYMHRIDQYRLDANWSDRIATSLGTVYSDLSKVEVFVPKTDAQKELYAYVTVEPDITAWDKSLMQQVWTTEAEDYYVQSGRFGQDLATGKRSIRNSVNARLLLVVDDD